MATQKLNTEQQTLPGLMFLEHEYWKKDQNFMAVLINLKGKEKGTVIARIYREFDTETKNKIYTAKDVNGEIVFNPTNNLYQLKENIKSIKPYLVKIVLEKEKNREAQQKERTEELTEVREKNNDNTQTR